MKIFKTNIFNTLALAGVDVLRSWTYCFEPRAHQWFMCLPRIARHKAMKNARLAGNLDTRYCTLRQALTESFDASKTLEGAGYWQKVINKYAHYDHRI